MWKQYCSAGQATDNNMADAHCMLDTQGYKHKQTGFVIRVAFPLQQWLHEPSLLRNTYIACIVLCVFVLLLLGGIHFLQTAGVCCISYGGPDNRDLPVHHFAVCAVWLRVGRLIPWWDKTSCLFC